MNNERIVLDGVSLLHSSLKKYPSTFFKLKSLQQRNFLYLCGAFLKNVSEVGLQKSIKRNYWRESGIWHLASKRRRWQRKNKK